MLNTAFENGFVTLKYIQHRCRTGNVISLLVILITVFIRVRFKINDDKVRNKNNVSHCRKVKSAALLNNKVHNTTNYILKLCNI